MLIKKLYYYFFYKMYKAIQYTSYPFGNFLLGFKASLLVIALEIWFSITILNYYNIFIDRNIHFSKSIYLGIVLFFSILSYITIDYSSTWKKYNQKFDQLPKKKNIIGSWIAVLIVLIIIMNFIFSFYLLFAQAKKNQTGPYAPEIVAKEKREDSLQKAQQIKKLKKIYGEK